MIPVGCAPPVLVTFADPDPAGYDPRTGCLKAINDLAAHHNALLREALRELQAKQHPAGAVTVVYADFFGPVIEMVTSPAKFGQYWSQSCMPRNLMRPLTLQRLNVWRGCCRVRRRCSYTLLWRPGEVQLQQEGFLRRSGGDQVQGSICPAVLGRRPPDGGRLPVHRRRLAEQHRVAGGKQCRCWYQRDDGSNCNLGVPVLKLTSVESNRKHKAKA